MEMKEDFLDAHQRHWHDAELLFQMQRWANADHLYGFAAECGLKALMEELRIRPQGKDGRGHIMEPKTADSIWSKYQTCLSGQMCATKFLLPNTNPFDDWLASQRYVNQAGFDEERVQNHRDGAKIVCDLLKKLEREGVINYDF